MRAAVVLSARAALFVPPALGVSCAPSSEQVPDSGAPDGATQEVAAEAQCTAKDVSELASNESPSCPWVSNDLFAWGPEVPVVAAEGDPPSPRGGTFTPGFYVLVSKSVFGAELAEFEPFALVPGETQEIRSGWAREAAYVSCSTIDTLFAMAYAQGYAPPDGETCRALSPRALSLWQVSTTDTNGNVSDNASPPPVAPYTASRDAITLIWVSPVLRPLSGVVGRYTIVDRFVLASEFKPTTVPGTVTPYDGSVTPFAPGERDPRCPANPPAEGDACDPDPVPLQCEYGGDAWARCTTLATCTVSRGDGGGAFQFEVSQGKDCPPNPAACPGDFSAALSHMDAGADAAPSAMDAASLAGPACNYDEGVCGYALYGDTPCGWSCRLRGDVGTGCPRPRPLAGMPCTDVEGATCHYDETCDPGFSFGPDMVCQYGHWAIADDISNCGVAWCPQTAPAFHVLDAGTSDL